MNTDHVQSRPLTIYITSTPGEQIHHLSFYHRVILLTLIKQIMTCLIQITRCKHTVLQQNTVITRRKYYAQPTHFTELFSI